MKKIEFFGCGVQKSGTTSLFRHFAEHPGLRSPTTKELHFFDDETIDWTSPDYAKIEKFFPTDVDQRIRFEITPIYSFWKPAIGRIRDYNPDAKLIFVFRDPFERALSNWIMERSHKREVLDFAQAIREGRHRLDRLSDVAPEQKVYTYVERGFYGEQVQRALSIFPREQLLFLLSDELKSDHKRALLKISDFLGVGPFPDGGPYREHTRAIYSARTEWTDDDLATVASAVEDDLDRFSALTGLSIDHWPVVQMRTHVRKKRVFTRMRQPPIAYDVNCQSKPRWGRGGRHLGGNEMATEAEDHENDLASERWDCSDGTGRRLHYAILAPQRTGSELLCAYLRQQGIGVPAEYLNPTFAPKIAVRLDSMSPDKEAVLAKQYYDRLIGKRTKNGIFGIKIQREQLILFTQDSKTIAKQVVQGYDRLIMLRRRDKVLQAISNARAMLTKQWQAFGADKPERVTQDDANFFPVVADCLRKALDDEAYFEELAAGVDPKRIRRLHYEDLVNEKSLDAIATWLWEAAGGRPANATVDRSVKIPKKLDKDEAMAIKERFLARIGAW